MLSCPDCHHILAATRIETGATGGTVEVNRCPFCGGVWFDHFEINRLPAHEAIRLSGLVSEGEVAKLVGTNTCPHCGITLTRLTGSAISSDTYVRHCSHCRGNWVSKKDLVKVKHMQNSLVKKFKILGLPIPSLSAILIPVIVLVFLIASIPFTLVSLRRINETRIRAREVIGTPSVIPVTSEQGRQMAIVSFSSNIPVTSEMTLVSTHITSPRILPMSQTPKLLHIIRLTDLSPQTTYTYTIRVRDEQRVTTTSPQYSFVTP